MEPIDEKEFAKAVVDEESKTFIVYVVAMETPEIMIYPLKVA